VRSIGIQPDVIIARADHPIADELLAKIALFCDVEIQAVVPLPTADVLYAIPLLLEEAHLGDYLVTRLRLSQAGEPDMREWRKIVERIRAPKSSVSIAIVGKYTALHDAYMSVREALNHAAWDCGRDVEVVWIPSGALEEGQGWDLLEKVDGIVVPGGFGPRGIEGMITAAGWARKNKVPYLGLCLGMQVMCIELARNALGEGTANSTEFDPDTQHPIIDLMPDQQKVVDMGGTMRLGLYPCHLQPGTLSAAAYGVPRTDERHRHRFEFNNWYRDVLGEHGLILSGLSPDGRLVEIAEMADHPLMIGCQFHPEFRSRPNRPHPLFVALIEAAMEYGGQAGSG
jgi:CTP synthase